MKPYYQDKLVTIYNDEAMQIIPQLEPVDLVFADPPYSSGGLMRSDRSIRTSLKYMLTTTLKKYMDFTGDNRDQRSFEKWCYLWMSACLYQSNPGAAIITFIDWRNIASMIDAVQMAGWVYRGILVWDKGLATRPDKGWFRAQSEYLITGTNGPIERGSKTDNIASPGVFSEYMPGSQKEVITQKPVATLRKIFQTRKEWKIILDPFCGSGPALIAAKQLGRRAIGIDHDERNCEIAARKLSQDVMDFEE